MQNLDENTLPVPEPGSVWIHRLGTGYQVLMITNQHSTIPHKYPITVVYKGTNGHIWSRQLKFWNGNMRPE